MNVPCKFLPGQYYELAFLADLEDDVAWLDNHCGSTVSLNQSYDPSFKKDLVTLDGHFVWSTISRDRDFR